MIEIDRLALEIRAVAARERVEALGRRVRDAALAGLRRRRIPLAGVPAGAYVFIERLDFVCAVSSAWDDDAIGDAVARGLAASLGKAPAQAGAETFRDRAEFLAAFLLALADGTAWSRWWFDEFDGLKPLGASAAIRTALVNEGDAGVKALARLAPECASRVARTLSTLDAARVLAWLGERPAAGPAPPAGLWRRSASLCGTGASGLAGWIGALVACEREAPGTACASTLETLRQMAALREAAERGGVAAGEMRADTPLASLQAFLMRRGASAAWLDRVAPAELDAIAAELAALAERAESGSAALERASTRHGGAFVLLGVLARLGWLERWQALLARDASPQQGDALARALALMVIARALAPHAAAQVEHDPALRLAMDPGDAGAVRARRRAIRAALRDAGAANLKGAAAALLHAFAQRVLGLAASSVPYLRDNALSLPAAVERDDARVTVHLGRAPLDVLLVLSGAKRGTIALPGGMWLDLREESAA